MHAQLEGSIWLGSQPEVFEVLNQPGFKGTENILKALMNRFFRELVSWSCPKYESPVDWEAWSLRLRLLEWLFCQVLLDVQEGYQWNSMKGLRFLEWCSNNVLAKFLVKVDDDVHLSREGVMFICSWSLKWCLIDSYTSKHRRELSKGSDSRSRACLELPSCKSSYLFGSQLDH